MPTDMKNARQFIEAAQREGFQVSEKEADTILGYMEGHDYILGTDEDGAVFVNDLAYNRHEHWEPYSIRDAILFASDMCADLIEAENNSDERQAQYEEDRKVMAALYEAASQWRG